MKRGDTSPPKIRKDFLNHLEVNCSFKREKRVDLFVPRSIKNIVFTVREDKEKLMTSGLEERLCT